MIDYLILLASVAGVGTPVGQTSSTDPKELITRLHRCSGLTEDVERLKCYDRESASLDKAISDGSLSVVSRSQIEKAHREGFGYSDGDRRSVSLGHEAPVAPVKEINSVIRVVHPATYGRYTLGLADGSVWQNVDLLSTAPTSGDKVQISKTAFGAYLMKIPYSESVHAKRLK